MSFCPSPSSKVVLKEAQTIRTSEGLAPDPVWRVRAFRVTKRAARWVVRWMIMRDWCEKYKHDVGVLYWLEHNPPPAEWTGSVLEWAFTEMSI